MKVKMDMSNKLYYQDLGLIDYREAWDYQEERFNNLVDYKRDPAGKEQPGPIPAFL